MPAYTRQFPARDGVVVSGGAIGIDGSVYTLDVYTAALSVDAGLIDDTGAGDNARGYLAYGANWAIGRLSFRGWLVGECPLGLNSVGAGTEHDITLTLQNTHTIAGKLVIGRAAVRTTKRRRTPASFTGMFTQIAEDDA